MEIRELQEERVKLVGEMEGLLQTRDLDGFNGKKAEVEKLDGLIKGIEATRELKEIKLEERGVDEVENKLGLEILNGKELSLEKRDITTANAGSVTGETYADSIIKKAIYVSPLFGACNRIVTGATQNIPLQDVKIGKFVKTAELGKYIAQNAKYKKKTLGAVKYTNMFVVAEELLNDSLYDLESDLIEQMVEAFGSTMDELIVKGDTIDGVEGLENFASTMTASTVKKITEDDIIDLFYSLPIQYRTNATWVLSDKTAKQLAKAKTADKLPLLYTNYNNAPVGGQTMILGRPVIINNHVADIDGVAVGKSIYFGDLGKAVTVGVRKDLTLKKDEIFDIDGIAVKSSARLDIKTVLDEAMVVLSSKIA